jgi:hypothetical protein
VEHPKLIFRIHAVQRMFERNVSVRNVAQTIRSGTLVEDYSAEMPEPSQLLLGFQGKRPVHVVVSANQKTNEMTIITVYRPDPDKWNKDFTSRRA